MDCQWVASAGLLAAFAVQRFVNRSDCFGGYREGQPYTSKIQVTHNVLLQHFSGNTIIGMHTISKTEMCKWVAWDFDNHTGDIKLAETNTEGVVVLVNKLTNLGMHPLVGDSDGRGGYHVWLFFAEAVPAADAHRFAAGLVPRGVEPFPKQPTVGSGYGSWLRLPGRHPRRNHWSRLALADMEWREGDEAATLLLDIELADAGLVPRKAEQPGLMDGVVERGEMPEGLEAKGESLGASEADDWITVQNCLRRMPQEVVDEYETWVKVGMAIHDFDDGDMGLIAWDGWSRRSTKHKPGSCATKWEGFGKVTGRKNVGIGTLVHMAGDDPSVHAITKLEAEDKGTPDPPVVNEKEREEVLTLLSTATGLPIRRWIQRCSEAGSERYFLILKGVEGEIEIGDAAHVLSYGMFRAAVYAQAGKLIRVERSSWEMVCRHLARIVCVEEIVEETRTGRLRNALEAYFGAVSIMPKDRWLEAAKEGQPFMKDGKVWIAATAFISWCRESRILLPRPYQALREAGWQRQTVPVANTTRSLYCAPRDSTCIPAGVTLIGK